MAKLDEAGLAALDLMIAKAKQDPTFITGIDTATVDNENLAHAVDNVANAEHAVADAVQAAHVNQVHDIDQATIAPIQAMNQETFIGVGNIDATNVVGGDPAESALTPDEQVRIKQGASLNEL